MNEHATISDEMLYAFVDGELDATAAARIESALARDSALAARVAAQRALRGQLQSHFAPVLGETVPLRLQAAAARAPLKARSPPPAWLQWGALAAALLLGLLLGIPFFGGNPTADFTASEGRLLAHGELKGALDGQLSGESGTVNIGMTLRTRDGRICRSFALSAGQAGVACRRGEAWSIDLLTNSTPASEGGYRQAGSALPEPLRQYIESLTAGEPLSPAEEATLLRADWQIAPAAQP